MALMVCIICLAFPAWGSDGGPPEAVLAEQRVLYQQAKAELDSGAGNRYQELRDALDGYPLSLDLDFSVKLGQLHDMTPAEARAFISAADGTPLAGRFVVAYLRHKAQDRRWGEFLGLLDEEPLMPELQCHYFRAHLAAGQREVGLAGARKLWDVGFSQDDACDPLFKAWMKSGGPDDELVWSRALRAFDAKNGHLIRYVKRFASASLQPKLDELASVYRRPSRVESDRHPHSQVHADILVAGLKRLAQLNPARAFTALIALAKAHDFTATQTRSVTVSIVRHSLFAERAPAPEDWIAAQVAALGDDDLSVIWLRNAIASGDWVSVQTGLSWLSAELRDEDRWQYWTARSLEALQLAGQARVWQALAQHRSFHGFMAADRLGQPYVLNQEGPSSGEVAPTGAALLGAMRAQELRALGDIKAAKEQWRHTLNQLPLEQRAAMGDYAISRDWLDLAIDAANAGAAWNRLDLRFPVAYWEEFAAAAEHVGHPPHQLIALARRESGLYPLAQSKVGARGLMQLMPSTARSVAKKHGLTYRNSQTLYQPRDNIALGSAYYSDLMTRYDDNRVKALAAYNAGPSRVARWSGGEVPVDQWVDSLPFGETREYVQAVLTYAVIYQVQSGQTAQLLSAAERQAGY